MKKYFIAVSVILAAMAVGLSFVAKGTALLWLECGIAAMAFATAMIYRGIARPIMAIRTGMELIKGQDFASRLAKVGQSDADSIAATFNSMMEQLRAERLKVREQNHFLDLLVEASPMGIIVLGLDGKISSLNTAAKIMLDKDNCIGLRLSELPGELPAAMAELELGNDCSLRLCDGSLVRISRRYFIDNGFQRHFILLESLTREVLEAERAATAKVIRVIAHEVNNTVAGVLPVLEATAEDADELLGAAASSCAERCKSLSGFVSRYAEVVKLPKPNFAEISLNNLISAAAPFLESLTAGRAVRLHLELSDSDPIVRADAVQIEQVLVNVVKNAAESIGSDGDIVISTGSSPATIVITDNGPGLPPDSVGELFSPFFSTKPGSTGIGLTLSSEILRQHDCSFRITTDNDGLTRFAIRFPR